MPYSKAKLASFVGRISAKMPDLEKSSHTDDPGGNKLFVLATDYRSLAIGGYVLQGSVADFRRNCIQAAQSYLRLFKRRADGDDVWAGFFKHAFQPPLVAALCGGDLSLAKQLAQLMTVDNIDGWTRVGVATKFILLNDVVNARTAIETAVETTGYDKLIACIIEREEGRRFSAAFTEMMNDYHDECTVDFGAYIDLDDELLCLDGIAFANLAIIQGLRVVDAIPYSEVLPRELVATIPRNP